MRDLSSVTAYSAFKSMLDSIPKIKSSVDHVLKATVTQTSVRHLCCSCVEWIPMSWSYTWNELISILLVVVHAKQEQNLRLCYQKTFSLGIQAKSQLILTSKMFAR